MRDARRSVRKVKSIFKDVVEKRSSGAVHDFRKETRQLQTIIDACGIHRPSRSTIQIRRRLQKFRHALSAWRDGDVTLAELRKARRTARSIGERRCWLQVIEKTEKQRTCALKKFFRKYKSLRVGAAGARAKAIVRKRVHSESMMDNLRLLLERGWKKWNDAIDDFAGNPAALELHQVRIKAKTLRYAIDLSQKFYPDNQLENASDWLKGIQDRVGAWHDELMLSQRALETFSGTPRDPSAIKVIRDIKEKEIVRAESARNFIVGIRKTSEYQRLRRHLAASVYAMADRPDSGALANGKIAGPIQ